MKKEKDSQMSSDSFQEHDEVIKLPSRFLKWLKTSKEAKNNDNEAKNKFVKEYLSQKNFQHMKYLEQKRKLMLNLLSDLSIHGLPNFVRSKDGASKISWSIVFFVSCIVSGYYIYQGLDGFLAYDVTTKIRYFF